LRDSLLDHHSLHLIVIRLSVIPSRSDLDRIAATERCENIDISATLMPDTMSALSRSSSSAVQGLAGKRHLFMMTSYPMLPFDAAATLIHDVPHLQQHYYFLL
jgi:hypothetical protein